MPYPNALETGAHILESTAARLRNQDITHQKTEYCYNRLFRRERKQMTPWLQSALAASKPFSIKKTALAHLLLRDYHCPAALADKTYLGRIRVMGTLGLSIFKLIPYFVFAVFHIHLRASHVKCLWSD
ncbi:MAG TPA: hypothetical protein VNK03_01120 [Gammaproteobacteria bacterium]|jgi:hypothetical protein|nr:hypothetical protein [Gammaproteobacteria bacterium]